MERDSLYNKSLDELVMEDKKLNKLSNISLKRDDSRDDKRDTYRGRRNRSNSNNYRRDGGGRGGNNEGRSGGGHHNMHHHSGSNYHYGHGGANYQGGGFGGTKVFVSNLSYESTWRSLKDHMRKAGDVLRADIFEDERGRSRGIGVVEYRMGTDAIRAIRELHQSTLDGRVIFVREDEHKETLGGGGSSGLSNQRVGGQGQGGTSRGARRSRSRSLSIKRRSVERSDRPRCRQIYIGNLPYSVSKHQLREAFKDFGDILQTEISLDEKGKSKGYGTVLFESRGAAEKAIRVMDQAKFNERIVTVRFDRNY